MLPSASNQEENIRKLTRRAQRTQRMEEERGGAKEKDSGQDARGVFCPIYKTKKLHFT
jgi:hypothetical protein